MYRMPCRACGRRVGVNTEICPSCGVRWPTHRMRDLLVEPWQTQTVYYRRNPLGWTAELLFVVFNVLMAGWLIGAWRVGPHNFNFEVAQHAENWESDRLLVGTAQVLLPWVCGSVILGLLTYFTRGPGVYLGLLVAVFMTIWAPVEDIRMTSPSPSAHHEGPRPSLSPNPKPPSVKEWRNQAESSSWPTKLVPMSGQTVAPVEPATDDPTPPPMFQSEDEIARCDSIIDARRRAACLNGIGLGDAASGPAVARTPATPSGLPDLARPVFLTRGGIACQTMEALMENSRLACATADQDTLIRVLVPRSVGQEYLREEMMGYTRIAWKSSDGRVGVAYAMMSQLRN